MISYAKLYRIAIRIAFLFAALGSLSVAHATYATLTPPPGWVQGGGALATYQAPSAAAWAGSKAMADAAIASASATSKIRVALPLAQPAAGRVAAAFLFANPALRTAVGIASWLGIGKVVWDAAQQAWKQEGEPEESGYMYSVVGTGAENWTSTPSSACQAWVAANPGSDTVTRVYVSNTATTCTHATYAKQSGAKLGEGQVTIASRGNGTKSCPPGWTPSSAGCLSPALTQPQMVELLNPANQSGWPMPATVPNEMPNTIKWPVGDPAINPGTDGKPAPVFLPTGNPVKNPQYNPNQPATGDNQPYLQPGIRVVPTPTTANPWQVDVQPINRPVSSPDANPNPITDKPSGGDNDKPREDDRDLCQRNPDILACAKPDLDTPDGDIPKTTRNITYSPDNLFGGGSCPANKVLSLHNGQQLTVWNWEQSCGYITGAVRPVVLLICAFCAFAIVAGGTKS